MFSAPFTMDVRSIGLFRIALGLVVFFDFAHRFRERAAFYADDGMLPRAFLDHGDFFVYPPHFQLFFVFDGEPALTALLALALGAAAALCIGWRPRLMAMLCWLLLASLELRNGLTSHAGDRLLLGTLFFAMFLPLGERFTLGGYRRRGRRVDGPASERHVLSPATAGLTLLVFFVYVSAGLYKVVTPSWLAGDHLYLTLSRLELLAPVGESLYAQGWALPLLTWLTLAVELWVPLLFFVTWKFGPVRCLAIGLLALLQLGMGLSLYVGLFPLISITPTLAMLPAWLWTLRRPARSGARATTPPRLRWRECFGTSRPRRAASAIAALGAAYVIYANVTDHLRVVPLEPAKYVVGQWTGLTQTWNMFQKPVDHGGWITIPATTAEGEKVDLLTGDVYRSERPARIIDTFPNYRWRIMLANRLRRPTHSEYLPPFLDYLCRAWNREHPPEKRITEAAFFHHPFRILPDHKRAILAPQLLARWTDGRAELAD